MDLREKIKKDIFYFDGATGSQLQKLGIKPGELPEVWNITHREDIINLGVSYFEAGANGVAANTFGANPLKYDGKSGSYSLREIIKAGMECALEARKRAKGELVQKDMYVGMDVGSLGKLLKPLGDLEFETAVSYFKESISLGVEYGAEYILIETMNDSLESKAAVIAAKEVTDVPIFVSNVYDETHKTMTGSNPGVMTAIMNSLGVDAVGANCSLGPDKMLEIVPELYAGAAIPVIFMPNAGMPRMDGDRVVYDVGPEEFASYAIKAVESGARMLGGCCGTTPEHIRQTVLATRNCKPLEIKEQNTGKITSYNSVVEFGPRPILIGERINPTGKKKLKEALRSGDMSYILSEAVKQEEAGADVLDVNVGLPEIDETAVLCDTVRELQAVTALPLQIDTSSPVAMEAALRAYNGKAMINSVNGKEEVMEAIFPLVKKYGGFVVALTLDESGIPETAEGRFKIAEKIVKRAAEYGIPKSELIFDPLAMAVSSDSKAARETLNAIKLIKERLGCCCSLGVSNVSFGLPKREIITSVFFTMAMECGLNAAIMNPFAAEMMKAYKCFLTLSGLDDNCIGYIEYADKLEINTVQAKPANVVQSSENKAGTDNGNSGSGLGFAVKKGMSGAAADETKKLLAVKDAMSIINEDIIPALNEVGVGFEKKTIYLPQLLMSAEAAKAAFGVVSASMPESSAKGPRVIMATVKGDIHDIGKNIVVALLKNYGFDVLDLGKDVPPEKILEHVKKEGIKMVGLSALMTTTVPAMEETIKLLHEYDPEVKVCVGGAVLTQEYADMIRADKYARTAMDTVRYAQKVFGME
ncbi:MAG: homocysteine S-methyltransferase family protein [Lachnospiraceae bacterium]|nr:homocysteine S-methyltransferase family protein [Lachnospiraceae bacterium]